jgi:ribosome-binding protein aMBF1 (putative translation factor)
MKPLPSPARCPRCKKHNKFTVHVRDASGLNVCRDCISSHGLATSSQSQSRHVPREGVAPLSLPEVPYAPSRRLLTRVP